MSLRCLPSMGTIHMVWEEMSFEDHGIPLGYRNGMNLAVLNLYVSKCLPQSFSLMWLTVWEQMFQDFQAGNHGGHLVYWNRTNLAILNLHITPMPPTKFGLDPTYGSGAGVVWRFSRWPSLRPAWLSVQNYFSNSESLCSSDAYHQVSAQSHMVWEMLSEAFHYGRHGGHLWYRNGMIFAILNLHETLMPSTKFRLNLT